MKGKKLAWERGATGQGGPRVNLATPTVHMYTGNTGTVTATLRQYARVCISMPLVLQYDSEWIFSLVWKPLRGLVQTICGKISIIMMFEGRGVKSLTLCQLLHCKSIKSYFLSSIT